MTTNPYIDHLLIQEAEAYTELQMMRNAPGMSAQAIDNQRRVWNRWYSACVDHGLKVEDD